MTDLLKIFDFTYYSINPFALTALVTATLAIFSFFLSFHLEKKSDVNRSLGMLFLSIAIWLYGLGFMLNAKWVGIAYFWAHIMYLGIALSSVCVFHISSVAVGRQKRQQVLAVVFCWAALLTFIWETFYLNGMGRFSFGFYPIRLSFQKQMVWLSDGFFVLIACSYLLSLMNFIHQLIYSSDPQEKKKIRFLIFVFLVFALSYTDLWAGFANILPIGYVTVFCVVVCLLSFLINEHVRLVECRTRKLENEIAEKAVEISQIIGELRATQLKLFETGKISAVASLSAGILHQISQPITAIHGFVRFIKKEMKSEDPFYRPICLMEEQSQYLKEMLADLMELIRHREIRKENIDVNTCIRRALNLLTDELRIRRVNWDLFLAEHLPLVHADSVHLQQVFMNVVINAIQALSLLPRGAVRYIKISSEVDKNKNQVVFSFKDTGPGLSMEDQRQIFEPFFSTKTTGTGIGLALCKDLIAEHQGSIDVFSTPGEGATFMITLPCAATVTSGPVRLVSS